MFRRLPDGIYDHQELLIRYEVRDGAPLNILTKEWVDAKNLVHTDVRLNAEWGTYPDIPTKNK